MTTFEHHSASGSADGTVQNQRLETISRQLRTPMTDILGMAHLLNDTVLEKDQQEYVQAIMRASHELLVRLDNSIDLASLGDDTLGVHEESFGITEALLAMVERLRPSASARGLGIALDFAPDVDIKVICDKARLSQAVYNLAASLIARHRDGALRLAASIEKDQWGENLNVIMTASAHTLDGDTDAIGTNETIEVTRRLARLMGGEAGFANEPGQPHCGRLVIRVGNEEEEGQKDEATTGAARILVAEDSRANQRLIGLILGKLGHEFEMVANGVEALEAVQAGYFDMVLMDLHMPQMDGMEACRKIRALENERVAMVPVVALTADVRPQVRTQVVEAGMDDYLSKPINVSRLNEIIQTCLNRTRSRQRSLAKSA